MREITGEWAGRNTMLTKYPLFTTRVSRKASQNTQLVKMNLEAVGLQQQNTMFSPLL